MQQFLSRPLAFGITKVQAFAAIATYALLLSFLQVSNAFAAADTLTGIDAEADIATPALNSAKPFIIAGVGVLALITAISLGKKLWRRVTS